VLANGRRCVRRDLMRHKRVLFIQHSDVDRPGLLGETLDGIGLPLDVIRPDLGQSVPGTLEAFSGLVLGGGPQGAYEQEKYPYLSSECALVRHAASIGKPVLGLCLGAQLMALALGARVQPGTPEIGFFEITLDPISCYDPLWRGMPAKFLATHWHGDVFDIPPGGMRLASSALTPNQLFRYGHAFYGLQFHLEMTPGLLREAVARANGMLEQRCVDGDLIWQQGQECLPALRDTASTVFTRWSEMLC
jgi:GMP synthase (glutamine-hydrolysing)